MRFAESGIFVLIVVAAFLFMPPPVFSATSLGRVSAVVEAASSSITQVQNLHFGHIHAKPTAGTVRIDPKNGKITTTYIYTGVPKHAVFRVKGTPKANINIAIPSQVVLSNGTDTMNVQLLTNLNGQQKTDKNGSFEFWIGGQLSVGANQPPGAYSGTYTVDIHY